MLVSQGGKSAVLSKEPWVCSFMREVSGIPSFSGKGLLKVNVIKREGIGGFVNLEPHLSRMPTISHTDVISKEVSVDIATTVSFQAAFFIDVPELSLVMLSPRVNLRVWIELALRSNPELAVHAKTLHSPVATKHESLSLLQGNSFNPVPRMSFHLTTLL